MISKQKESSVTDIADVSFIKDRINKINSHAIQVRNALDAILQVDWLKVKEGDVVFVGNDIRALIEIPYKGKFKKLLVSDSPFLIYTERKLVDDTILIGECAFKYCLPIEDFKLLVKRV